MNKKQLKGRLLALEMQQEEAKDLVTKAIQILYLVSGTTIFFGFVAYFAAPNGSIASLGVSIFIGLVLTGLGFWARKDPLMPIIIGFVILTSIYGIEILFYPLSLYSIAVKIAFIIVLGVGIFNVFKAKKIQKAYQELKMKHDAMPDEE